MKRFYSDYVRHCIRYYLKYPDCIHTNSTSIDNWTACDKAFSAFSENDRELFRAVYGNGKNVDYSIVRYSNNNCVSIDDIYKKCGVLENMIARMRGLI